MRARSDLSPEEKVRLKGPALPKRKKESAQAPSDEYEWLRFHIIKKIIQCPDRHRVPMHARQCIEYLKLMSPGDVVVLWLNHCATQHSRGHCNLHAGNDSYKGADMYKCLTVKLMVAINEAFVDITSFKCGEVAGDLQKGNIRECCLTLNEGFENCAPGTQDEAGALVAVTQIYLDGISDLDGHCAVVSTAGFSSNMERLVLSKLKSKSPRIRIAKFSTRHLQFAARPAPLLDVEESATRVTQEFERLDKEVIQPFLDHIGRSDVSFIQHVKSHPELSFVTDHRDKLAKQYTLSWLEEKNKRVNTILQACFAALRSDEDATVGSVVVAEGQENVILKYANNHCEQLYKLPGADPTTKLEDFYVRDILRNMRRNGGKKCQELLQQRRECAQCAASASGVCGAHEATTMKRECSAENCTNWAVSGGVCCTHGARVEKRECTAEGCTKWAVRGGLCCTHGATTEKQECSAEECEQCNASAGGVCSAHEAKVTKKKTEKKECSAEGCTNVATCADGGCDTQKLNHAKILQLEGMGFKWKVRASPKSWPDWIAALRAYKDEHGNVDVPQRYSNLGAWVNRIRYKKNELDQAKIRQLEDMGFKWKVKASPKSWPGWIAELQAYKDEHGNVDVPQSSSGLGAWVGRMRKKMSKNELDDDEIRQLEDMGFKWRVRGKRKKWLHKK